MPVALSLRTRSADDTRALGAGLARALRPGDVVLLAGDLGAGKTTLTQGIATGLGVTEVVTSPTFTLVRSHPCPPGPSGVRAVLHADLYRLDHLTEVADLAIGELVEEGAVAVVEWGDVGAPVLGEALVITLASPPGTEEGADAPSEERAVAVSAGGSWTARAAELAARLGDWSCP